MTKKDFLGHVLGILGKNRALAQVIQILLEGNELDDTFMNGLTSMMEKVIHTTQDQAKKAVMEKGLTMIKKVQEKEKEEQMVDQEDLTQLEGLLSKA